MCSLSMNGCEGGPHFPLGMIETHNFSAVSSLALALECLSSSISELNSKPPPFTSGIIRLQVPIQQQIKAIDWLYAQDELFPRIFFSGRSNRSSSSVSSGVFVDRIHGNGHFSILPNFQSVAGVGSAVLFTHHHPFSYNDWKAIKRFLSKECPLIRAYGSIRFDARANISSEWEAFGSFYFMIPQVEFNELEESSMLATTIAWDNALSWTWTKAIKELQATIHQISSTVMKLRKKVPGTFILSNNHVPCKSSWDVAVSRALKIIRSKSTLTKVVLARRTRVITATGIDPISWLSCLKTEGEYTYQFLIQPPKAPAFIGNTPEQLFHRKQLDVKSEALAGTRARSESIVVDLQIELDLLSSPKDHLEFTIVRESIRKKLEASFFS